MSQKFQYSSNGQSDSSSEYSSFEASSTPFKAHAGRDSVMDNFMDFDKDLSPNKYVKKELSLEFPNPPLTKISFSSVSGLQSIEDFEMEDVRAENPKVVQLNTGTTDRSLVIAFHDKCGELAITPEFDIRMISQSVFSGKLSICKQTIQLSGSFNSKKEIKTALCIQGLDFLGTLDPKESQIRKRSAIEALRQFMNADCTAKTSSEDLERESWIPILNNYTQQKRIPSPEYTFYRKETKLNHRFASTCRIATWPLTPFGSGEDFYSSKSAAKQSSAREAVLWLRSQGDLPDAPTVLNPNFTVSGLRQSFSATNLGESPSLTQAEILRAMIHHLHLLQPELKFEASGPAPEIGAQGDACFGFWNACVRFTDKEIQNEPALAGEIGKVFHIYGKKNAKAACIREVLRVLEEIKEKREAQS
ncbi:Hypothetical protein R9X50_00784200 [Acrodontium crateriforme]|uniref:Uncharacterized protein n=1 Tax=Acrodontium crateriforme TaxID=150365 RepID=A0AAQ3MBW7_9PEZI|nr:Hypothetical protein R9X50_00784200 [Acrodontium crateriforme]